jgi:methionyl-tRNA formyltransferase
MKIYALATLSTGLEVVDYVHSRIPLSGLIGLAERNADDLISGYQYLAPYCAERNISFVGVRTYGLTGEDDRATLSVLDIDVLLVMGWQRLIPQWLIKQCKVAAIGGHGSASGITGGRGRSPQNWALIMGKTEFHLSIFRITSGIDSGDIIDSRSYTLNDYDDIQTSYYKAALNTGQMIVGALQSGIDSTLELQDAESARYLPQRLPEDGAIDWSRDTKQIFNFIRALSRPYPGAFCDCLGGRLTIWHARPFEITEMPGQIGEVVALYHSGAFLVRTGDGLLLVDDYSLSSSNIVLSEGAMLHSVSFTEQIKRIVSRHQQKYPQLPLADDILALAQD